MKNIFFKIGSAYLILTFIFTSLMIAVHFIPQSAIVKNVESSVEVLQKEGVYKDLCNIWLFKLDNYTDALMLHIAAVADTDRPVKAALLNYRLDSPQKGPIDSTIDFIHGVDDNDNLSPYGRYWHGNQLLLRPLLTLFDYSGIRIVNYILFLVLIGICVFLINKTISSRIALLFVVSLILINFPMIPLSMQFSTCFYISFISIALLLSAKTVTATPINLYTTFFVIGGCTSFFDLLTTPQLTLGLPLIFYCLKSKDHKMQTIIGVSLSWIFGYGILWATKWLMVYLFADYNILENAINAAKVRSSSTFLNEEISIVGFLIKNPIFMLASVSHLIVLLISLGAIFIVKDNKRLLDNSYLLLLSMIVPVWYICMLNHSVEHCWFTWRAVLVPLLSLLVFIYNVIIKKSVNR